VLPNAKINPISTAALRELQRMQSSMRPVQDLQQRVLTAVKVSERDTAQSDKNFAEVSRGRIATFFKIGK
jgi:hypothetical protein